MTIPPTEGDPATLGQRMAQMRQDDDPVDRQAVLANVQRSLFAGAEDPLRVGRFVVIERLGTGASGVVYAAYDPQLDRRIALKLLRADAELGDEAHARLQREAQALARLSHPHVVAIHDVGDLDGRVFIAMELLAGGTLRQWAAAQPRSQADVLSTYLQAGAGLAAAHAAGLVHRDFKPDNVLLDERGNARVVDFGLAREQAEVPLSPLDAVATGERPRAEIDMRLTQTGALLGTPAYMAPEQFAGTDTDARTDQYAFCVALYEALYGERPFAGNTVPALAMQVARGQVRAAPAGRSVPARVRRALLQGLDPQPDRRHADMAVLLTVLRHDRWARWRRRGLVGLGLAAAVGLTWAAADQPTVVAATAASCSGFEQQLAEFWNDDSRDHVAQSMAASGHPRAAATWARIEPELTTYAETWVDARREACEAREVRHELSAQSLDRRRLCLDRASLTLAAALQRLREADRETVARAGSLVPDLSLIEECRDDAMLEEGDPLPVDPVARAQAQEIEARLAEIRSLRLAGRYAEAQTQALALVEPAAQLDHAPTFARVLLGLAAAQVQGRRPADAEQTLVRTIVQAERGRADRTRAAAMLSLVKRLGERQQFEAARRTATLTEAVLARLTHAMPGTELRKHLMWGHLDWLEANYDSGIAHFDQAIASRGDRQDTTIRELYAEALIHRGAIALEAGKPADALPRLQEALELRKTQVGEDHPDIATILANLGGAHMRLGSPERALESLERSLAIRERRMGADHERLAPTLASLGGVATSSGRPREGLAHLERALPLMERSLGPEHPELAVPLTNMALAHLRLDQPERARALVRRAVQLRRAGWGEAHARTINSIYQLAYVEQQAGDDQAAQRAYSEYLELLREHRPDDVLGRLQGLVGLADIALNGGHPRRGRELMEQALPLLDNGPAHTAVRIAVRFNLARALADLGQVEPARPLAEQALAEVLEHDNDADQQATIEAWLAQHPAPS